MLELVTPMLLPVGILIGLLIGFPLGRASARELLKACKSLRAIISDMRDENHRLHARLKETSRILAMRLRTPANGKPRGERMTMTVTDEHDEWQPRPSIVMDEEHKRSVRARREAAQDEHVSYPDMSGVNEDEL